MTFWHLRVPDKSKHHVHILQACVSFSLAFACNLLCSIVDAIQSSFWQVKNIQYPLVELKGARSVIHSSTWKLTQSWQIYPGI